MKTASAKPRAKPRIGRQDLAAILSIGLLSVAPMSAHAQDAAKPHGLRIFISVDMEGVTGVVMPNQLTPTGNEYERYRLIMTNEVNAAITGARKAGATEFVIADGHGNFQNLLLDSLPKDAKVVRGEPRPLIMMDGVQDGTFDGAMFIGYHASSVSLAGVRAHSFSSAAISELKVNGVPVSEGYWNAAVAGDFNVPVILATGDDVAVAELKPVAKSAELVAVKKALGFHAAETLTPAAANELIEAASERAVRNLPADKPFRIKGPVTVDLTFHFYQPAELLTWLPSVQRTGARSVRFTSGNMVDATRFLAFISSYNFGLQP
ncbi:MAG: M55 family metallopeptidase [Proteobacteria bacterium]|nr:M55 family metallopeptidase [Pseudomonadota bacterium]